MFDVAEFVESVEDDLVCNEATPFIGVVLLGGGEEEEVIEEEGESKELKNLSELF